jgi:hypothetical protein
MRQAQLVFISAAAESMIMKHTAASQVGGTIYIILMFIRWHFWQTIKPLLSIKWNHIFIRDMQTTACNNTKVKIRDLTQSTFVGLISIITIETTYLIEVRRSLSEFVVLLRHGYLNKSAFIVLVIFFLLLI